jgi:hypothetical protein
MGTESAAQKTARLLREKNARDKVTKANRDASEAKIVKLKSDLTKATVDLSTFKKKDTVVWTKKARKPARVSSASRTGFGGSRLGTTTKLQRKKGNRSARGTTKS